MQTAAAIIGWSGAVLLLVAYGLVATQRLSSHSVVYHVLNLAGAISLALYALAIAAWPNVVLNAFWSVVGVIGIFMSVRAIRKLRRPQM
jgi:O-antigen ligase